MATMTTVASDKTPATTVRPPDPYRTHKRACAALAVVIVVVCIAIVTYIRMSPFSRNAVLERLTGSGRQHGDDSQLSAHPLSCSGMRS